MFELVLRIGFSLLVVFGLMWGLAKVAKRPLTGNRGTGTLSVLNRQPLSRTAAVAVVQVADKAFVVGVTDHQVTMLGETDLAMFERHPHVVERRDTVPLVPDDVLPPSGHPITPGRLDGSLLSPRTWRATVDFLRDRTTRR